MAKNDFKAQLLASLRGNIVPITIPGYPVEGLHIRATTGAEMRSLFKKLDEADLPDSAAGIRERSADELISTFINALCTADGSPIFTEADREEVSALPWSVIQYVKEQVNKLDREIAADEKKTG